MFSMNCHYFHSFITKYSQQLHMGLHDHSSESWLIFSSMTCIEKKENTVNEYLLIYYCSTQYHDVYIQAGCLLGSIVILYAHLWVIVLCRMCLFSPQWRKSPPTGKQKIPKWMLV